LGNVLLPGGKITAGGKQEEEGENNRGEGGGKAEELADKMFHICQGGEKI
jgi:hypothetical protein